MEENGFQNSNQPEVSSELFPYEWGEQIGRGTFGLVYKATVKETNEEVAIKKVFQDKRYQNRELAILRKMDHQNIINLRFAFYTPAKSENDVYLNYVTDYIPQSLINIIRKYWNSGQNFPFLVIKLYAYQLLRGISYLHSKGICHRDIKPQNLLVDTNRHHLKIWDLGSAKSLDMETPNVNYICSRYYRAPELIFGGNIYTNAIDIWSAACVIGEMFLTRPMFAGTTGVDQILEIMKVLGTPTRRQVRYMNPLCDTYKFPAHKWISLDLLFPYATPASAKDLLRKMLLYDSEARITPIEAMQHEFFDELRDEQTYSMNKKYVDQIYDFSDYEKSYIPQDVLDKLIPEWYRNQ